MRADTGRYIRECRIASFALSVLVNEPEEEGAADDADDSATGSGTEGIPEIVCMVTKKIVHFRKKYAERKWQSGCKLVSR